MHLRFSVDLLLLLDETFLNYIKVAFALTWLNSCFLTELSKIGMMYVIWTNTLNYRLNIIICSVKGLNKSHLQVIIFLVIVYVKSRCIIIIIAIIKGAL